jgi:hypothetical protein
VFLFFIARETLCKDGLLDQKPKVKQNTVTTQQQNPNNQTLLSVLSANRK